MPARNPAHSRATYEAPTTRVLPGGVGRENRSSLVMPYSLAPGISGYRGLPPVEEMKLPLNTVNLITTQVTRLQ